MNTSVLTEILMGVLWLLPFIIACCIDRRWQLNINERDQQELMPIWCLIYVVIMMYKILDVVRGLMLLLTGLGYLLGLIPFIGYYLYAAFNYLITLLANILSTQFGLNLFCSVLMILLWLPIKTVLLRTMKKQNSWLDSVYDATSGKVFYHEGDILHMHRRYYDISRIFNIFSILAVVAGCFYLLVEYLYPAGPIFNFTAFPAASVLMLTSIHAWLSGVIPEDEEEKKEKNAAKEKVDWSKVEKDLKRLFRDRILYIDHQKPLPDSHPVLDYEEMRNSDDPIEQNLASYFSMIESLGGNVVRDYVRVSEMLLKHTSVLIMNPFYRDMTYYLSLPLFHELMNNHKVLVLSGRPANQEDIVNWMQDSVQSLTNVPSLYKVDMLDHDTRNYPDVGILGSTRLYDLQFLKAYEDFFSQVTLVILLEPSFLMATGQMALRNILQMCEDDDKKITYCILDRNADGLVDSISHAARQSITEVIASPCSSAEYCRAFWKAEGPGLHHRILPKISHYLGIGMEGAVVAMKHGARKVQWYSRDKMPLIDLKWNIEQYYPAICQATKISPRQYALDQVLHFDPYLWQTPVTKEAFMVVEDEFCNAFEMNRIFSSRIQKNGFVSVLCENYMLRDYMCSNADLFTNDPKAIPSIVPDYSRSQRNFVLRTLMNMAAAEVDEESLCREMSLHNISCHATQVYDRLVSLVEIHTGLRDFRLKVLPGVQKKAGRKYTCCTYSITKESFDAVFDKSLRHAYYVVENEQMKKYSMGNTLMGLVEQVLLPGQHFVQDGKAYEVRSITRNAGIIVRRAADHISGRRYYRQMRAYQVDEVEPISAVQEVRGLKMQSCLANCDVTTPGYLEMKNRSAVQNSYPIMLETIVRRHLHHKELLRIELPDSTPEIRWTLCLLLNELFTTVFPSDQGYVRAIPHAIPDTVREWPEYAERITTLVPDSIVNDEKEEAIYIIEDSNIDMGLLVAVTRHLIRFLEIVADYVDWSMEEIEKKQNDDEAEALKPDPSGSPENPDSPKEPPHPALQDLNGENEETLLQPEDTGPYLFFGYDTQLPFLDLKETRDYLSQRGFLDSNLHASRIAPGLAQETDETQHYCDFCGAPMKPGTFTVLKDGRERCEACSKTAVKSIFQFRKIFKTTLREMEELYDIKFKSRLKVRMVNSKKINEDKPYEPSPRFDGRVLGYAQRKGNTVSIFVENGAPLWRMKSTLVHELTHIWQYENWDDALVQAMTEEENSIVHEGMAVWSEVQYLLSMGEYGRAQNYANARIASQDAYGTGFRFYLKSYPLVSSGKPDQKNTPFGSHPLIKEQDKEPAKGSRGTGGTGSSQPEPTKGSGGTGGTGSSQPEPTKGSGGTGGSDSSQPEPAKGTGGTDSSQPEPTKGSGGTDSSQPGPAEGTCEPQSSQS